MPGHLAADLRQVRFARSGFVDEPAIEHHQDSICQFEQFVEIFTDQEHGGTAIRTAMISAWICATEAKSNPEARIRCDHDVHLAAKFPRQHHTLDRSAPSPPM